MKAVRFIVATVVLLLTSSLGFSHAKAVNSSVAPASITVALSTSSSVLDSLRGLFSGTNSEPKLLSPEEAFQVAVSARNRDTLVARLTIADGYYLDRDRIAFHIESPSRVAVADVSMPPGKLKDDPTFGRVEIYEGTIEALIGLSWQPGDETNTLSLRASYQGCNDPTGVCYPPINETLTVSLPDMPTPADLTSQPVEQQPRVKVGEASGKTAIGQGDKLSRRYAFGLSLVYVLAMAMTYALAGVAAGLAGTMLSVYLQNPWVLGSFDAWAPP